MPRAGIPVVGGNVSFYNESRGRDIDPTPVVGVVGVIDHLEAIPPGPRLVDGAHVIALGATHPELGGSEWARLHDERGGTPPIADLDAAVALHDLVRALVAERVVAGVHDCAEGGLAVAIAEMAIGGSCGATLRSPGKDHIAALAWFSESASRVVLAVEPARVDEINARAAAAGVPWFDLGVAGGDRLIAEGAFDVSVSEAATAWREAIPRLLGREPARAT